MTSRFRVISVVCKHWRAATKYGTNKQRASLDSGSNEVDQHEDVQEN
jgi:hypothetical protein